MLQVTRPCLSYFSVSILFLSVNVLFLIKQRRTPIRILYENNLPLVLLTLEQNDGP